MMSPSGLPVVSNLDLPKSSPSSGSRCIANFKPSVWGDQFLHCTTADTKVTEAQKEEAKELKKEIYKELLSVGDKPLKEQLCLIDSIERLNVAHHFEKLIEDALHRIHETTDDTFTSVDLFRTSLGFRLLRQHGFKVSSDVFKGLRNSNGTLKEVVASDVQGILNLYEACHVRIHGEEILDEALILTTSKLKLIKEELKDPILKEQVIHALKKGVHKSPKLLESLHYMQVYGQFPTHNKTLLRFAKIEFNLLQSVHKKQLSELTRWWKEIGIGATLPVRDRIPESYFWGAQVHDPQHSTGKKITASVVQFMSSIDDIYDAYGTLEELEIFTEAILRGDKSCLDQLPEDYKQPYQALILDVYEEMERDLAAKGNSVYVKYARDEGKTVCQTYLIEASWRHKKYIPTFDEYMEIAVRNTGFLALILFTFLDLEMASHEAFQWICSAPKPVKAVCIITRILNDIGSPEVDKNRGHASFMIASYMRQYDVSYEQACKQLLEKTEELWKDINEAMILPTEVPMPLFKCMLNVIRLQNIPMMVVSTLSLMLANALWRT